MLLKCFVILLFVVAEQTLLSLTAARYDSDGSNESFQWNQMNIILPGICNGSMSKQTSLDHFISKYLRSVLEYLK